MRFSRLLVWFILSLALVLSGVILMVAPSVGKVRWVVAGISVLLLLIVVVQFIFRLRLHLYPLPNFLRVYCGLILVALLTTFINQYFTETIVASKNFFQFLSIPFAMYFFFNEEKAPKKFVIFSMAIALIQPLFAFMQYFMFRGGWFVGDRISGTFGGALGGAGGNSALAMFLTISIAYVLALAIKDRLSWKYALVLSAYFVMPIAMTHAKASVVFLLIMLAVLFFPLMRKRLSYAFAGVIIGVSLLAAVFFYQYRTASDYTGYWNRGVAPQSIAEFVEKSINYNVKEGDDSQLNRLSAIKFWYKNNSLSEDPVGFLFGHGLGSAQDGGTIVGHVVTENEYFGYGISLTALPRILWDLGVIGAACFLVVFILGFRKATFVRSSKYAMQEEQAFAAALQVAMIIFTISTVYKLSIINEQPFSAFVMMEVGVLALLARVVERRRIAALNALKARGGGAGAVGQVNYALTNSYMAQKSSY